MDRKKVFGIIAGIIILAIGITAGMLLFSDADNHTKALKKTEGLEPVQEAEDQLIKDLDIVDYQHSTKEEKQKIKEEAQALCDQVFPIIFNVQSDTQDYTDQVTALFLADEEYRSKTNVEYMGNIFKEFQYKNFRSEYLATEMDQLTIWPSDFGDICIIGTVKIKGSMDGVEEGEYSFPFTLIAVNLHDKWEICTLGLKDMCKTEGLNAYYVADNGKELVAHKGEKVFSFYFQNYDVFIKEGISDKEINLDDYDVEKVH